MLCVPDNSQMGLTYLGSNRVWVTLAFKKPMNEVLPVVAGRTTPHKAVELQTNLLGLSRCTGTDYGAVESARTSTESERLQFKGALLWIRCARTSLIPARAPAVNACHRSMNTSDTAFALKHPEEKNRGCQRSSQQS